MLNMVDEQVETMIMDSITFMNFLGYCDHLPSVTTIWIFGERLSKIGRNRGVRKKPFCRLNQNGSG